MPDAPKRLWAGLSEFQTHRKDPETLDVEQSKFRLLATQALEAVRTMEERIIEDPREADIGAILGFGFAPFTGGPLSMIDGMGLNQFQSRCRDLEASFGSRFAAPKLLQTMTERGLSFYE